MLEEFFLEFAFRLPEMKFQVSFSDHMSVFVLTLIIILFTVSQQS